MIVRAQARDAGDWAAYDLGTPYDKVRWLTYSSVPYQIWWMDDHTIVCEPRNGSNAREGVQNKFYTYKRWGDIAIGARNWAGMISGAKHDPVWLYLAVYGRPRMMKITRYDIGGE